MRRRPAWLGTAAVAALPVLFLGYFFIYPLISILVVGLAPGGDFDGALLLRVFTSADIRGVAWFTLWQAVASTALTLIIGLPGAYVLARYRFRGRAFLRAAVTVPFVLPTVVVGTAFLALFGSGSPLGLDLRRTVWAILAAHIFFNYAIVVRTVGSFWERIDPSLEDAARALGADRWQAFRTVTLPLLRPAIASAASIVFLFTFTSFGVILILGDLRFATIEVEIWRQAVGLLDNSAAAALALVQLAVVALILIVYSRYQESRAVQFRLAPARLSAQRPVSRGARAFVAVNVAVMALLVGAPLGVLIYRSVRPAGGFGFDYYGDLVRTTPGRRPARIGCRGDGQFTSLRDHCDCSGACHWNARRRCGRIPLRRSRPLVRRPADASTGHVCGDDRIRLSGGTRFTGRPPDQFLAHPVGSRPDRRALRRPDCSSADAQRPLSPSRGCLGARGRALARVA